MNLKYHYPGELTVLRASSLFLPDRDWPQLGRQRMSQGLTPLAGYNAFCVLHCKQLGE
jgi:hypothetical protein